jgi:hypothetical protein
MKMLATTTATAYPSFSFPTLYWQALPDPHYLPLFVAPSVLLTRRVRDVEIQ